MAYRGLRDRFARAMLVPLHNEMLGSAQHRDKYPMSGGGALTVKLPALAPGLRKLDRQPAVLIRRFEYGQCDGMYRLMRISSCSAGCVEFISNSASSICVFYWPT